MKILFVAGFGPIVRDQAGSESLYVDTLGIEFERDGEYLHTQKLDGTKHFALWPLSQAAISCFGVKQWPKDVPQPQAWLEMDVDNILSATSELQQHGYTVLVQAREEVWGQIVTRMLTPEGILLGLTYTPQMRKE